MLWILAGRMIDGTGAPPREAVAVGIVGDRIVDVRLADSVSTAEEDGRVRAPDDIPLRVPADV